MSDSNRRQRPLASERVPHRVRVLTLRQWAELNSLGVRTAKRIIASGNGPKITQLSDRRIGIQERHNEEWLASRVRDRR
jgi:predicted DNA-binding transcriptional regulator AlpA